MALIIMIYSSKELILERSRSHYHSLLHELMRVEVSDADTRLVAG